MIKTLHSFTLSASLVAFSFAACAQFSPNGVKIMEQNFHIDQINDYELFSSGFSIVTMTVDRNSNNQITDMSGTWNSLFGDKQNKTTSSVNGNVTYYNNQIIDSGNGISTFSTETREILESDGTRDTTVTTVEYDPASGIIERIEKSQLIYLPNGNLDQMITYTRQDSSDVFSLYETQYFFYNSNNMLDSVRLTNSSGATSFRSIYYNSGTQIDSVYHYSTELGNGMQLMQSGYFSYPNGSTILELFSDDDQDGTFTFEARWTYNAGTTGLKDISQNELPLYPNPSVGIINLESHTSDRFTIYNQLGAIIKQGSLHAGQNILQLSDLEVGCYFIRTEQNASSNTLILSR